jgi:type I restriction enzyme, S subunit
MTYVPLKYLARLNPEILTDRTDPALVFNYIDIGSTGRGELLVAPERVCFGEAPSRARRVLRPGDSILSTVRTYLRAAWTVPTGMDDLVASTGFVCLRPTAGVDSRYLGWLVQSDVVVEKVVAESVGVSYPAISPEKVGSIKVPCPPKPEQQIVADYLDRETTRIDALVSAKRAIVARLYEKCEAELRRAIGRSGLVRSEAPTIELRRVLERYKDEAPPGTPLVTAYRDGQVTLRELRRANGYTEAAEDSGYFTVSADDVVLHGLDGFAGAIGTAESSGACSPVYHVLRPLGDADPHYWGRMLRVLAVTGYLALFFTSTRERAIDMRNWDVLGRIPVPVVPTHEQRRIGHVLRQIPVLQAAIDRSILRLQEHRRALITAAVTGHLDATEAS